MARVTEGTLQVDGATIHYKTAGEGPVLLLLPGGDGDADAFDLSLPDLTDRFKVVVCDRRGLSRSALESPHRAAAAFAGALGRPLVRFAGDHAGFVRHPRSFAARCRDLFSPYFSS